MMKKELYFISLIFLTPLIIILFISSVHALAVSSSYGTGYPLSIYPGETRDIQFKLMTNPDEDNLLIKVEILDDKGIASLIDSNNEYKVNQGELIPVNLRIKVNQSAKAEQKYNIIIKLSDISPSEGEGSVSFKGSSTINFDVLVLGGELKEIKPTGKGTGVLFIFGFFILILIISITIVIWLVVRNRRNRFY